MRQSIIILAVLLLLCSSFIPVFTSTPKAAAAAFAIGDTVEVYNTGSSGLLVLDASCGNKIGNKPDGSMGTVLSGPIYCASYNRWQIRWSDGLVGWSAEAWLTKVQTTPTPITPPGSFTLSATALCDGSTPYNHLSWTSSSSVASYHVYRNGALYYDLTTLGTTFDNTPVSSSVSYSYFIRATNSGGSTDSNTVYVTGASCTTPTPILPAAPTAQYTVRVISTFQGDVSVEPAPLQDSPFDLPSDTGNAQSTVPSIVPSPYLQNNEVYRYKAGTTVTFRSSPDHGFLFDHWKIDGDYISANPCSIVVNKDLSVEAIYIEEDIAHKALVFNLDDNKAVLLSGMIQDTIRSISQQETDKVKQGWLFAATETAKNLEQPLNIKHVVTEQPEAVTYVFEFCKEFGENWEQVGPPFAFLGQTITIAEQIAEVLTTFGPEIEEKWILRGLSAVEITEPGKCKLYALWDEKNSQLSIQIEIYDGSGGLIMIVVPLNYDGTVENAQSTQPILIPSLELQNAWVHYPAIHMLGATANCPVELAIYDSDNDVTGVVNGEIKNDIPGSMYFEDTIRILTTNIDSYKYQVSGIDNGEYDLSVSDLSLNNQTNIIDIKDASISAGSAHNYSVSQSDFNQGSYVVSKQTTNGDGTPEQNKVLQHPEAIFACSVYNAASGTNIAFDASASYDNDGAIQSYSWDFGDGQMSSGVSTTHSYHSSGYYMAILTVTDNDGLQSTYSAQISVVQVKGSTPLWVWVAIGAGVILFVVIVIIGIFRTRRPV